MPKEESFKITIKQQEPVFEVIENQDNDSLIDYDQIKSESKKKQSESGHKVQPNQQSLRKSPTKLEDKSLIDILDQTKKDNTNANQVWAEMLQLIKHKD